MAELALAAADFSNRYTRTVLNEASGKALLRPSEPHLQNCAAFFSELLYGPHTAACHVNFYFGVINNLIIHEILPRLGSSHDSQRFQL